MPRRLLVAARAAILERQEFAGHGDLHAIDLRIPFARSSCRNRRDMMSSPTQIGTAPDRPCTQPQITIV